MDQEKSNNQKQFDCYHRQCLIKQFQGVQAVQSQYLQSYIQTVGDVRNNYEITRKIILKGNSNFKWDPKFRKTFQIITLKTDFQSIRIQIGFGNFVLQISAIMVQLSKDFFKVPTLGNGKFGQVFQILYKQNNYAIKSITLIDDQQRKQQLLRIYQQYFLCCLADSLSVGPKMYSIFGYDLIITKDRALFAMEKCQRSMVEFPLLIEKDLIENLKLIHSIGFMHLDIKPSNMAFSKCYRRHVFIDFGLSKLIGQKLGQKTRTGFVGTLAYCSEQMKKCFFLQKQKQVDFYFNDLQAVKNTIRVLKAIIKQNQSSYQQSYQNQLRFFLLQKEDTRLFRNIIPFFQLKFQIFQENLHNILQLIHLYKIAPKTFSNIFQDENINQKIRNEAQINQVLKIAKQDITKNDYKLSFKDQKFSNVFTLGNKIIIASKILPISQIIELQSQKLALFLNNEQFAYKLYNIFNPFNNLNSKNSNYLEQKFLNISYIIKKIYEAITSQSQQTYVLFFCQKVRRVLIYFYERLKKYAILYQLRLLFLALHDIKNVQKIEDDILEIIQDKSLKLLTILQFQLGWKILRGQTKFPHSKSQQWLAMSNNQKQGAIANQQLSHILKRLIYQLFYTYNNQDYQQHNPQQKVTQQELIWMQNFYQTHECKQTVSNIRQLYNYCKNSKFKSLKSFVRLIYSCYSDPQYQQINQNIEYRYFWRVFRPLKFQYHQIYLSNKNSNLYTKSAFQHLFYNLQSSQNIIATGWFWQRVNFQDHQLFSIENMTLMAQYYIKFFTQYQNYTNQNIQIIFRVIICLLKLSYYHLLFQAKKKINIPSLLLYYKQHRQHKQFDTLLDKLHTFSNYFISKCKQATIFRCPIFQSKLKIIKIMIQLMEKKLLRIVQPEIKQIFQFVKPSPDQDKTFSLLFLLVLQISYEYIQQDKQSFIIDIIYQIGKRYIEKRQFYIFQYDPNLLSKVIFQFNNRKQFNYSFQTIMSYINLIDTNKNRYSKLLSENSVFYGVKQFIKSTPNSKIVLFNLQTMKIPSKVISGLKGFFIFSLFQSSINQITDEQKRVFLKKFLLVINKMPHKYIIQVRAKFMYFYRKIEITIKSRKKLSNARREFRFSYQGAKKVLERQISKRANNIYKKQVLKKISYKLSRLFFSQVQQNIPKTIKN